MIFVVTSRCNAVDQLDMTNGAVTRLMSWKKAFPDLVLRPFSESTIEELKSERKSYGLVLDFCGEKLPFIYKAWTQYRPFNPCCFFQDSTVRFYRSRISQVESLLEKSYCLINMLRGFAREFAAFTLFKSVGYVSYFDGIPSSRTHEIRMLGSILDSVDKNIKKRIHITLLRIIANFEYEPNALGASKILNNREMRLVCQKHNIKFALSGVHSIAYANNLPHEAQQLIDISLSGPFAQLADLAGENQIMICPAFFGSGVKNKIIEGVSLKNIILAWSGVRGEFPYPYNWVDYFYDPCDLAAYLDFLVTTLKKLNADISFFELAERYRMLRFLSLNESI